jgi:hypothetical protein
MVQKPMLARKRFIPEEIVYLKDDVILKHEDNLIITKWNTLNPRRDIAGGVSAYFIDKGIKVSKVYDKDGRIVYWYCDIIKTTIEPEQNTIIFEDLLIDVIIKEDGSVVIMDLDELADALELKLITEADAKYALRTLDALLKIIYSGRFSTLQEPVNGAC